MIRKKMLVFGLCHYEFKSKTTEREKKYVQK